MSRLTAMLSNAQELGLIALVAVSVALASTLAGSVLDHVHQVDAEGLAAQSAVTAVGTGQAQQQLAIKPWNVSLTLPLAPELPRISYGGQTASSLGFSAADVERLGSACQAARNALGTLLRLPAGAYASTHWSAVPHYFIATLDGYDYAYQLPQTACTSTTQGQALVNRETSIIREGLSSLTPLAP